MLKHISSLNLATAFLRLPAPARQGVVLVQSALNRINRYGQAYQHWRDFYDKSQWWDEQALRKYQQAQLLTLLREARRSTEYYAEALGSFSDGDFVEMASSLELSSLPVLPKPLLKGRTPSFFNRERKTYTRSSTSGSTGSPLVVEYDRASVEQRFALIHRLRSWGGVGSFERNVRLSGRQITPSGAENARPWVHSPFERMLLVSTYHLREPHLAAIVEKIAQFRPVLLDGYPTAVAQIAEYVGRTKLALPSLRMVITTAETLGPDTREAIESNLGVPLFDYYAASEGVPLIAQCERGTYHVWSDSGLFEFLDPEGRPVGPGEEGEIVATSFCQWKTPLIRYRTGDVARLLPAEAPACGCGRKFPAVAGILGRVEDLVHTRDGRRIGMFAYRTLKHVPGLHEAQIIQEGYESFRVRIVPDGTRDTAAISADIRRIFASTLGYSPNVVLDQVELIQRGPNGKFRSVVRSFEAQAQ